MLQLIAKNVLQEKVLDWEFDWGGRQRKSIAV
jgi:hypothetical protein